MMPEYRLDGRVAIVTGGSQNIGKGIALCLAEAGADVVVSARTPSDVEAAAKEVESIGVRALGVPADATREADVQRLVDTTLAEFGQIDILVNNAGGGGVTKFLVPVPGYKPRTDDPDALTPMTLDEWRQVIDLNLTSVFLCCRAVGPHMLDRGRGKIINVTSPMGTRGGKRQMIPYSSAKAAQDMFTKSLALEWARHGVNVNGLGPGFVPGKRSRGDPGLVDRIVASLPMRRASTARETGLMAVYLASPASDFMTGQIVQVDGGQVLA